MSVVRSKRKRSHERGNMPNGEVAVAPNKVLNWPGVAPMANKPVRPPWLVRLAAKTGVIMTQQKGWKWDPQNIGPIITILTFFLVLAGGIAGAAWYLGIEHQRRNDIERRLEKQEADASKAVSLGSYKAGAADGQRGHVNTNTNTGGH